MEKNKLASHCYSTRQNKIPKLEENNENPGKIASSSSKTKSVESPAAAKFCMISGYASPPCRLVTLSQHNENEIVWDLTSPSARKYPVLFSDKKTSTPNQTPTRNKREIRPRIALCKKNIALAEDKSGDLVNELAALNDMVNTEQAQIIMTPPQSVRSRTMNSGESPIADKKKPAVIPTNLNTSDVFDDDSFFSDSILLSTQALEKEAFKCSPSREKKSLNDTIMTPTSNISNTSSSSAQPSPRGNVTRRSFDLDLEDDQPVIPELKNKVLEGATNFVDKGSKAISQSPYSKCQKQQISKSSSACASKSSLTKNDVFNVPGEVISKAFSNKLNQPINRFEVPKPLQPAAAIVNHSKNASAKPIPATNSIGIKRIVDEPRTMKQSPILHVSSVASNRKSSPQTQSSAQNVDPFDDDDDDLLCAIADQVESQYVSGTCGAKLKEEADDDIFFQPEVLEFISQIESEAIKVKSTEKSTADLMEEKRQAAIRKREERLMSRR